jgi:hypothetical protein
MLIESQGYVGVPDGTVPHIDGHMRDDPQIADLSNEACKDR